MDESSSFPSDKDLSRLTEIVLDHLGIPRPGQTKYVAALQDDLLPYFLDTSRHVWLAASPMPPPPGDPIYYYLWGSFEEGITEIPELNGILEEMGAHDMLRDVANTPDVIMLADIPIDPYEERLLRAAGHPYPGPTVKRFLRHAAVEPRILTLSSNQLERAAKASYKAHSKAHRETISPPKQDRSTDEKSKRRKLLTGLGKLFSGLVLLSGNAIAIPTVPIMSVTAIPILSSLAAGVAAVGEGAGQVLGEGE